MKRLMVLIALSFLVEILVSCSTSTSTEPSASDNSPPQVSTTSEKISTKKSTASVPPPSATQRIKPSSTPPKPPPTSTKDPNLVFLPSSPDVPPSDVLAQIAYLGGGGGPDAPHCELVCGNDHVITLQGYSSFQQLRILVYTIYDFYEPSMCGFSVGEYTTEWYVTVDRSGYKNLSIKGASTNEKIVYVYYVYDARTGDFIATSAPLLFPYTLEETGCSSASSNSSNSCPGAPPQRMVVGESGYVCTAVDNVKVRDVPSRSGNEIIRIAPGTEFDVKKGPSCSDDWSWWYIETDEGIEGWISEGGDEIDSYFICPAR
jgi:hypothetical protein